MLNNYEGILFDFDGVLGDTEPVHQACWADVLAPFGVTLDWDTYVRHCIGVSDQNMIAFLHTLATGPVSREELWAQYPRKKQLFRERTSLNPPIPPATRELVATLAGTHKLAVVSSSGRAEIEPLLELTNIRGCFGALVCGEDVKLHKPAPDPYLLAAGQLGIRTALVVEDSEAGAASGAAAGFDVLRVYDAQEVARLVRSRLAG
jgi:beta-phosphoglucomutase